MARRIGFRALYLSGGSVAANSFGMPDLGIGMMVMCREKVWLIPSWLTYLAPPCVRHWRQSKPLRKIKSGSTS
jgi:hypothetical protein